jgi:vacuolar protein sorting-associated protein 45
MINTSKQYIISILNCIETPKILLLDDTTITYISSIYTHSDLLKHNVHLTTNIKTIGANPLDLEAIIFIQPTEENITLLTTELGVPKFPSYHIFFSNILKKQYLKILARSDIQKRVKNIKEKFIDYHAINNSSIITSLTKPTEEQLINSLAAIILSYRTLPVIRYQKDSNLSLIVAKGLADKISSENNLFNYPCTSTLLLIDRSIDPVSPLVHCLSYQALLFDILHMNNLAFTIGDIKYSLVGDKFYEDNKNKFWPDVVANMDLEVKRVSSIEKKIKDDIGNFVCEFYDFEKAKIEITKHVSIISEITKIIVQDKLQLIYNLESQILKGYTVDIRSIINDDEISTERKDRFTKLASLTNKINILTSFIDSFINKPYEPVVCDLVRKMKSNSLDYMNFPTVYETDRISSKPNVIVCFVNGASIAEMTINVGGVVVGSHVIYSGKL